MNITDISGIGGTTEQLLKTHGIDSVEAVARAPLERLVAVPGIGANRAAALKASAIRLLSAAGGAEGRDAGSATVADSESDETVKGPEHANREKVKEPEDEKREKVKEPKEEKRKKDEADEKRKKNKKDRKGKRCKKGKTKKKGKGREKEKGKGKGK